MRMVQGVGDFARNPQRLLQRELALAVNAPPQGFALDARDDVEDGALVLARIEQGQDVWVLQAGEHANLSREALSTLRGPELGVTDLEGDRTVVAQIAGAVDGGHATAAELSLDRVSTGEWCVRVRDRVVHASRPGSH